MQLIDCDKKINAKDLSNLENALGMELPTDYKKFLLENNGGYVPEFLCTPNFTEVDLVTRKEYTQSSNVDKFYSLSEIEEEISDNMEDPVFSLAYIPIAYDSCGNIILLDTKKDEAYGYIFFANHERYDENGFYAITKISCSFNEFIQTLFTLDTFSD